MQFPAVKKIHEKCMNNVIIFQFLPCISCMNLISRHHNRVHRENHSNVSANSIGTMNSVATNTNNSNNSNYDSPGVCDLRYSLFYSFISFVHENCNWILVKLYK